MDYTQTLTITTMVFNRLKFLDSDSVPNQTTISAFVWEVMNELEPCFKVSVLDNGTIDLTRIGDEAYYTVVMQSIVADIVSVYALMYTVGVNAQGTSTTAATVRFLKRAKAGSAEVEWGELSTKDGVGLWVSAGNLIDMFKKSAARKARNLGCILDICEDCTAVEGYTGIAPILVVSSCGCS